VEKGTISDWDALEACLDHVIYDRVSRISALLLAGRCCCFAHLLCCQHPPVLLYPERKLAQQAPLGSTHQRPANCQSCGACCACCLQIGWARGREGGALVAEPNFLSRCERERLCQLMFEVLNLAGYYAADQAVLSLYAIGRLSGTVVDIGYGKTGGPCERLRLHPHSWHRPRYCLAKQVHSKESCLL
jgi:hypothetical protein